MYFLLPLIAIVLSIIAVSKSNGVLARMAKLEKRFDEDKKGDSLAMASVAQSSHVGETSKKDHDDKKEIGAEEEYKEGAFIQWLKEDWLLKLGGVLVIMGVLFFLSITYSAVGPQGKVAIGYIFGAALMAFGFWYAKKQLVGGSAIHVIGATVVIITTYVARLPGYDLFDPYMAMLLMFLTSVCVALTAFAYKRSALAHVGLCMSAAVPVLVTTGHPNFFGLLMYLGVVVVGVLWLAFVTQWRTLLFLSLIIISGYSWMYVSGEISHEAMLLKEICMVVAFGVLFYFTSLLSIVRSKGATGQVDGMVALLNAGFALMWIIGEASKEIAPIYIALIGLIYAAGFFLVYKITNVYTSFMIYGGVSLGMITTSIMLELSGRAEITALLLIGAGVTVLTYYLSKNEETTKTASFFNLLPLAYVVVTINSISRMMYRHPSLSDVWKDLFIIVLAMGLYYALWSYFMNRSKNLAYSALTVANLISIAFVWDVLHILIHGGFATVLSHIIYTIIGLIVLFTASQENNPTKAKIARIWLGLVAARVIFWDAWQTGDIALGVFICVVIGILLLSSTLIIKKVSKI